MITGNTHLNYYFDFGVCPCFRPVCLSVYLSVCPVCLSAKLNYCHFRRKFGEQTSRILDFKPEGLEG